MANRAIPTTRKPRKRTKTDREATLMHLLSIPAKQRTGRQGMEAKNLMRHLYPKATSHAPAERETADAMAERLGINARKRADEIGALDKLASQAKKANPINVFAGTRRRSGGKRKRGGSRRP